MKKTFVVLGMLMTSCGNDNDTPIVKSTPENPNNGNGKTIANICFFKNYSDKSLFSFLINSILFL